MATATAQVDLVESLSLSVSRSLTFAVSLRLFEGRDCAQFVRLKIHKCSRFKMC